MVEILPAFFTENITDDWSQRFEYLNYNDTWEEIGPLNSSNFNTADVGRLSCIEIDPVNDSIVLAGSPNGGLYYTLNKGNTWHNAGLDKPYEDHGLNMPTPGIGSILIIHKHEKTYWIIATGDKDHNFSYSRGVIRSTDYGKNWHFLNGTEPENLPANNYFIRKLIQKPGHPETIFAATSRGVYKTINALAEICDSVKWTKVLDDPISNGEGYFDMEYHKTDSNTIILSKEYRELNAITGDEILISYDCGNNWDVIPGLANVLPVGSQFNYLLGLLELTPANTNLMYVYIKGKFYENNEPVYYNDLWKYRFIENDWVQLNAIPYELGNGRNGFAVSPVDENLLYCATVPTYYSTDGGNTWKYDNDSVYINGGIKLQPHIDIQEIKFNKTGTDIWAATDGGPYLKSLPDTNWINKVNNIGIAKILKFDQSEINPDFYVFGGWDVGSQFFNKGENLWSQRGIFPADGYGCTFDDKETGTYYVVNYAYDHNVISRFKNWDEEFSSDYGVFISANVAINPNFNNIIYVSLYDNISRSLNQGESWEVFITPGDLGLSQKNSFLYNMHVAEGNGNYLYLEAYQVDNGVFPHIFKTTNVNSPPELIEWTDISSANIPQTWISGIEVDNENPDKIWVSFINNQGAKIMEYDCKTWSDITGNLQAGNISIRSIAHLKSTDGALFAGSSAGVFYRENNSVGWLLYKPGLPNVTPLDLKINYNSRKIVAGLDGRGLWESSLPIGYSIPESDIEGTLKIMVWPNPSNKLIKISGSIFESKGKKRIRIYDTKGNRVYECTMSTMQNSIELNIENLGKGMFITEISTAYGNFARFKFINNS